MVGVRGHIKLTNCPFSSMRRRVNWAAKNEMVWRRREATTTRQTNQYWVLDDATDESLRRREVPCPRDMVLTAESDEVIRASGQARLTADRRVNEMSSGNDT